MVDNSKNIIQEFTCVGPCGEKKPLTKEFFYFRKTRHKFETICIECKKNKQRKNRNNTKDITKNNNEENLNPQPLVRATEESFPSPDKSDKDEIFKVFNLLKQWRDELQQKDPEEFNKIWKEVKDVSKR